MKIYTFYSKEAKKLVLSNRTVIQCQVTKNVEMAIFEYYHQNIHLPYFLCLNRNKYWRHLIKLQFIVLLTIDTKIFYSIEDTLLINKLQVL